MPDSQKFWAHWLSNWLWLCYKWERLYLIASQTARDVFCLRKFSVHITSQLGSQLLTEVTSIFWNYLRSLLHSESILFYYHGEIQAYEHIILRIIRESLHNNTIIALKWGRKKKKKRKLVHNTACSCLNGFLEWFWWFLLELKKTYSHQGLFS